MGNLFSATFPQLLIITSPGLKIGSVFDSATSILISFGYVFYQTARRRYPAATAVPFAINLIANLSFTPLFFGLRNVPLATLDILVVWSTILWIIYSIWPRSRWVALAQIPYLIWVSIATTIQVSIFWMN